VRTHLVIGDYQAFRPRWYGRFAPYWLYSPVVWPMQARMLAVLKRNIERAARARTPSRPLGKDRLARCRQDGCQCCGTC
jgi:hypothetical protein